MIHITMTGLYVGFPVCNFVREIPLDKEAERKAGNEFAHPGVWMDNPDNLGNICPDCVRVWNEEEEDEAEKITPENCERKKARREKAGYISRLAAGTN